MHVDGWGFVCKVNSKRVTSVLFISVFVVKTATPKP